MLPFDPLFRNPHLETIASHYWPRPRSESRWPLASRLFETEPGVQVLVESQDGGAAGAGGRLAAPTGHLVLVHGLEGSGAAGYIRSLAFAALAAGFVVHRFHMRTCGGTEHLSPTLYHAGLTGDLRSVVTQLSRPSAVGLPPDPTPRMILIGFSLGGNVVLKLAGELADAGPALLRAVVAVSAPIDLAACTRRLAEPENRLYQARFVRRMRARLRATGRYSARDLAGCRSVVAIDDQITAPAFGFGSAEQYYRSQSALHFLSAIRVPTLLVQAQDDPLVPFAMFDCQAIASNRFLTLVAPAYGGHVGFLARRPHRFWLDGAILEWIAPLAASKTPLPY